MIPLPGCFNSRSADVSGFMHFSFKKTCITHWARGFGHQKKRNIDRVREQSIQYMICQKS